MRLLFLLQEVSNMSEPNRFLMHRVVEHIKECGIEFDTADLEEHGIEQVIAGYGWYLKLSEVEKDILYRDLFEVALRFELAEVVRSMDPDEFTAMHGEASPESVCPEIEHVQSVEGPVLA